MAKTTTAVATPTLDDIKAQKAALAEQEKALKEQKAAAKEAEKAAAEAAKKEAEEKAAEAEANRQAAIEALASEILDGIGTLDHASVLRIVNPTKLAEVLEATKSGSSKSLVGAIDDLETLGGLKGPKASRNGTGETKEFAASGELTAMQKRILLHLLDAGKSCNRTELTIAANGKEKLASGRLVTMDGNQIGQRDIANRHPRSLLGRGLLKDTTIGGDAETKAETVFELTKEGKIEAKKLAK